MKHSRIRTAAPDDIRESGEFSIRDLYNEVRRAESREGRSPLAPPHYGSWSKAIMQRKDGSVTCLVAEDASGKVNGFAFATQSRRDDSATLHKLVIAPKAQGMGLGSKLIHAVTMTAKQQGKNTLCVSAEHGEGHAGTFYQKLGFIRSETKESKHDIQVDRLTLDIFNASLIERSR